MTHLRLREMNLLHTVVATVDVVELGSEHMNDGVALEVFDGPAVQFVHLLQIGSNPSSSIRSRSPNYLNTLAEHTWTMIVTVASPD